MSSMSTREASAGYGSCQQDRSRPSGKRIKFRDLQELSIRTCDLPQVRSDQRQRHSAPADTSRMTPVTDLPDSVQTPRTPIQPSSGKKRRRRTAAQIDRKFKCQVHGCSKAYGSEGSLKQHVKLKHDGKPDTRTTPKTLKVTPQVQTDAMHNLSSHHAFHLFSATPSGTRNVTIRPATHSPSLGHEPSPHSTPTTPPAFPPASWPGTVHFALTSVAEPLNGTTLGHRARSYSMPSSPPSTYTPTAKSHAEPRSRAVRSSKTSATPRPKGKSYRLKTRSQSDSVSDPHAFDLPSELSEQLCSFSDDPDLSPWDVDAPIMISSPSDAVSREHSRSLDWTMSGASLTPDEEVFDKDILSVLATCEAEDSSSERASTKEEPCESLWDSSIASDNIDVFMSETLSTGLMETAHLTSVITPTVDVDIKAPWMVPNELSLPTLPSSSNPSTFLFSEDHLKDASWKHTAQTTCPVPLSTSMNGPDEEMPAIAEDKPFFTKEGFKLDAMAWDHDRRPSSSSTRDSKQIDSAISNVLDMDLNDDTAGPSSDTENSCPFADILLYD